MNDKNRQPQTGKGQYLQSMAQDGHFKQKLAETALALTECYCKADLSNRPQLGTLLASEVYVVLRDIYGWKPEHAGEAQDALIRAFRETLEIKV